MPNKWRFKLFMSELEREGKCANVQRSEAKNIIADKFLANQEVPIVRDSVSLGAPFAARTANGLVVNFYNREGGLRFAMNQLVVEFRDAKSNDPADVGTGEV